MFNLFFSSFNLDLMCSTLCCNKFWNEDDLNMVLMLRLKSLIIWNIFGEFVKFGRTESWPCSLLNGHLNIRLASFQRDSYLHINRLVIEYIKINKESCYITPLPSCLLALFHPLLLSNIIIIITIHQVCLIYASE